MSQSNLPQWLDEWLLRADRAVAPLVRTRAFYITAGLLGTAFWLFAACLCVGSWIWLLVMVFGRWASLIGYAERLAALVVLALTSAGIFILLPMIALLMLDEWRR